MEVLFETEICQSRIKMEGKSVTRNVHQEVLEVEAVGLLRQDFVRQVFDRHLEEVDQFELGPMPLHRKAC